MSPTLEAPSQDALILPPNQRLTPAYRLLASVDLEPEPAADAAWEAEISQHIARFDAGQSSTVPASDVFARVRKIAPSL